VATGASLIRVRRSASPSRFHAFFMVLALATSTAVCNSSSHQRADVYTAAFYDHNARLYDLSPEQEDTFRGVGQVHCDLDGDLDGNEGHPSTAFLVGTEHMITSTAHAFLDPRTNKLVSPDRCHFVTFSQDGRIKERIPIVLVRSRWQDNEKFGNPNEDVAIAALAYAPRKAGKCSGWKSVTGVQAT